jgi:hypothetical protein
VAAADPCRQTDGHDEPKSLFATIRTRPTMRKGGGGEGKNELLCHTLVYRTEKSGRVWKPYIYRLQRYERFPIGGILTHAYRLFSNRAKDSLTFIVFLSDSKTTKIFSKFFDLTKVFRLLLWLVWLFKLVLTPLRKHRYLARSKRLSLSYSTCSHKPKFSLFHALFHFENRSFCLGVSILWL